MKNLHEAIDLMRVDSRTQNVAKLLAVKAMKVKELCCALDSTDGQIRTSLDALRTVYGFKFTKDGKKYVIESVTLKQRKSYRENKTRISERNKKLVRAQQSKEEMEINRCNGDKRKLCELAMSRTQTETSRELMRYLIDNMAGYDTFEFAELTGISPSRQSALRSSFSASYGFSFECVGHHKYALKAINLKPMNRVKTKKEPKKEVNHAPVTPLLNSVFA